MERNWWAIDPRTPKGAKRRAALKAATDPERQVQVIDDGKSVTGRWKMRYCHSAHRAWASLAVQCEDHHTLARSLSVRQAGDVLTLNGRYTIRTDASPAEVETLLETIRAKR